MKRRLLLALVMAGLASGQAGTQSPAAQGARSGSGEETVWYFYRVKWGYQNEFLDLFQKNHYPVLKAQLGQRITAVKTYVPRYHGDGRADWTFAVALTFRDMSSPSNEEDIIGKLYPDRARFDKEEQRRFELLDAHWDVPLNVIDFEARPLRTK
jgi:hypothetical protein